MIEFWLKLLKTINARFILFIFCSNYLFLELKIAHKLTHVVCTVYTTHLKISLVNLYLLAL